ncbi:hypothetical protein JCM10049v2_005916 [Rhodotorula toruloides]
MPDTLSPPSQASGNSNASHLSQSKKASLAEATAVKLITHPFDPHAYTRAVHLCNSTGQLPVEEKVDEEEQPGRAPGKKKKVAKIDMAAASQAPYFETFDGTDGHTYIHRECAVTGIAQSGRLEVAHLVAREVGNTVGTLVNAGVLPKGSVHDDPWNKVPLCHDIHNALDHQHLSLAPIEDEVIARLVAEIRYQEMRCDEDPVRPPFSLFYARLDGRPVFVELFFDVDSRRKYILRWTTWDDDSSSMWSTRRTQEEMLATAHRPGLPPFLFYCSGNAVIATMRKRIAQLEPAPDEIVERTAILQALVQDLWALWMLTDAAKGKQRAQRAATALRRHFPNSPYTALLDAPGFTYDQIPLPSPSTYTDTGGYFIRAYANGKSAPLLRPLAIADDHDEALSASNDSASCSSDAASSSPHPSLTAYETLDESTAFEQSDESFSKDETSHGGESFETRTFEKGGQRAKWELSEWLQEQQVEQTAV